MRVQEEEEASLCVCGLLLSSLCCQCASFFCNVTVSTAGTERGERGVSLGPLTQPTLVKHTHTHTPAHTHTHIHTHTHTHTHTHAHPHPHTHSPTHTAAHTPTHIHTHTHTHTHTHARTHAYTLAFTDTNRDMYPFSRMEAI